MTDKEKIAIERIRLAAEMSENYYNAPLIIMASGGKDSDVCLHLAKASGINYEVQHNHTTADAPETVRYVRETFHKLECNGIKCTVNYPKYKGELTSMWSLVPQKLMPPTRLVRYCCDILKEQGGRDRMICTGVRWAESNSRKKTRAPFELLSKKKEKRRLLSDNDDKRHLFENCKLKAKRVVNPIIDWADNDVWEYIESEHIETNPLYCDGQNRVGCIGCPLARKKAREMEFIKWPAYKQMYIMAFNKMLKVREERKVPTEWKTGQEVFNWWMEYDILPGQISVYDALKGDDDPDV